jgi:hypothetical protein
MRRSRGKSGGGFGQRPDMEDFAGGERLDLGFTKGSIASRTSGAIGVVALWSR